MDENLTKVYLFSAETLIAHYGKELFGDKPDLPYGPFYMQKEFLNNSNARMVIQMRHESTVDDLVGKIVLHSGVPAD